MENKIVYHANAIVAQKNLAEKIAEKAGISLPSSHLAILIASLAPLDEANNNGHRLTKEASEKFLKTIHQAQVNFSHLGAWFVCGSVIGEWIDYETKETKVAFTFYKDLYQDEYLKLLEAQAEGNLGVSFELSADTNSIEKLNDGTINIHDFEYTGIGLLGVIDDKSPAYNGGRIHQFACNLKNKVQNYSNKELIFAEQLINQCDTVLSESEEELYILSEKEISDFVSEWQEKFKKNKKRNNKNYSEDKTKAEEKTIMTEEQKKMVETLRAELEGYLPQETKDEQLLDEKFVAEIREAKSKKEAEEKSTEEKVEAADKKISQETFYTVTTYGDDGTVTTNHSKDCIYTWVDSEGNERKETVKMTVEESQIFAEQLKESEKKAEEAQAKVQASEEKISELEAKIQAQAEEIQTLKAEKQKREAEDKAKKLEEIKASLKGNKYVADFSDEDYFDNSKIEKATLLQERDDLKAENEKLKKSPVKAEEVKKEKIEAELETGHTEEKPVNVRKLINKACK